MNLPKKDLLKGCKNSKEIEILITQAENVLKTWQPWWSPFLPAPIREEAIEIFSSLNDLNLFGNGGYPRAERQRVCFTRAQDEEIYKDSAPINGIQINGNFLFDKPSTQDFRNALEVLGCSKGDLGDIWIIGDRGAQAICTDKAALKVQSCTEMIREVEIEIELVEVKKLQLPAERLKKKITTIEASKRLDAIASAGFGLSRGKILTQIRSNKLRINWLPIKQPSREIAPGDRIQLEQRGSIKILNLELTKRGRWKIELVRE